MFYRHCVKGYTVTSDGSIFVEVVNRFNYKQTRRFPLSGVTLQELETYLSENSPLIHNALPNATEFDRVVIKDGCLPEEFDAIFSEED